MRVIILLAFLLFSSTSFGQQFATNIHVQGKIQNTNVQLDVKCVASTSWQWDTVYTYWASKSDSSGNFSGTVDTVLFPPKFAYYYFIVPNCHGGIDSFQFYPRNNDTIYPQLDFCEPLSDQCEARFFHGIRQPEFRTAKFSSYSRASTHIRETFVMGDGNTLVNPGSLHPLTPYYLRNFEHTYPKTEHDTSYEVSLYLYDSLTQCRDTQYQKVYIANQCNLRAEIDQRRANDIDADLTLKVWTNTGHQERYEYFWYFNDTFKSNAEGLMVKEPIGDSIKVNLKVVDTVNQCVVNSERYVVPGPCHKDFSFKVNEDPATKNPKLELTNKSLHADDFDFLWKVRKANSSSVIGTSYSKDYALVLPENGRYVVILQKYTTECLLLVKEIDVDLPRLCAANFLAQISTDSVYLVNSSTTHRNNLDRVSCKWKFGDGDSLLTAKHIVSHGYQDTGSYQILLTIYDSTNQCTSSYDQWIRVDSLVQNRCGANFTSTFYGQQLDITSLEDSSNYDFYLWESNVNGGNPYTSRKNQSGLVRSYFWNNEMLVCNYTSKTNRICQAKECRIIKSPVQPCNAEFDIVKDTSIQFGIRILDKSTAGNDQDYRWYFGDGDTSTSRTPTHDYNTFGKYNLCLRIFGFMDTAQRVYCESEFCKQIGMDSTGQLLKNGAFRITVEDGSVSVSPLERYNVHLYPNPNKGVFYIDNVTNQNVTIQVFDMRGVEARTTVTKDRAGATIHMDDPKTGIYILNIMANGHRFTARVMVE